MKVPNWFVIGCVLLVLNALIVLSGALTHHAAAKAPVTQPPATAGSSTDDEALDADAQGSENGAQAETPEKANAQVSQPDSERALPLTATSSEGKPTLPEVPSLDELPANASSAGVVSIEDFKQIFSESSKAEESVELAADQLDPSYFDALKLRLKSVEYLTKSSQGLVEEASVLFKRGEVVEAQKLIGMATQLREMAATLLVTRQ